MRIKFKNKQTSTPKTRKKQRTYTQIKTIKEPKIAFNKKANTLFVA